MNRCASDGLNAVETDFKSIAIGVSDHEVDTLGVYDFFLEFVNEVV